MHSQEKYTVKQLAKMAGVSVRTLHLYDQIGLLKPHTRTEAKYRVYGVQELLRLQQILFYRELDFPLQEIRTLLGKPDFNLIEALECHKEALKARQERIVTLLATLDKTIVTLKQGKMLSTEELYEGLPKEQAAAYRKEAIEKYGQEAVDTSEQALKKLSKEELAKLGAEAEAIRQELFKVQEQDPKSTVVQTLIARHYASIRKFWGTFGSADKQAEAYKGLGQLYVHDERFTMVQGQAQPAFARFLSEAMAHYADTILK
ncbi:MAG TPA: MerR family transcriptional regulator [Cytophagales bacterium]|nr:MerR family transcriptional regulator [Cytophagales bacterium]